MLPSETTPSLPEEDPEVSAAIAGDLAAFAAVINRHQGKILRLASNITQNQEDAEDVLQDTFLKAYQHRGSFQGNSRFSTWLIRIAMNEALMKLRKRKTGRVVSLDDEIDTGEDTLTREIADWREDPEQEFTREELGGLLLSAVASLALPYRSVFALRDIEGLSTEETAEALGLSVAAVKSRLLRARLQLREKLDRFFRKNGELHYV